MDDLCLVCNNQESDGSGAPGPTMRRLYHSIGDYEYGIERSGTYHECGQCGFLMQIPRVDAAEIPSLYPEDYQAHSGSKNRLYAWMKDYLITTNAKTILSSSRKTDPSILEIGCGNGHLLEKILELNADAALTGVDIVDLGLSSNPRITFYHGQVEEIALPPASFDIIYCSNLIEHVPDPIFFLKILHALLRPGGVLIIITPNHNSLDRYVFGRKWGGYHFPRHITLFNDKNIVSAMDLAGLSVDSVRGAYAWWAISLANCLYKESARRGRGLVYAAITVAFLPFDLAANLVRRHGSMTVKARRRV